MNVEIKDVQGNNIPETMELYLVGDNKLVFSSEPIKGKPVEFEYTVTIGTIEIDITNPNIVRHMASTLSRITCNPAEMLTNEYKSEATMLGFMHRIAPVLTGGYELELETLDNSVNIRNSELEMKVKVNYIITSEADFGTLQRAGFFEGM